MRKGGGKQKGASWEREVCVMLSRWVTAGKQDDVYWRAAMSGGRATVAFKKGKSLGAQVGDISCIDPVGNRFTNNFAVEAKFYSKLDYEGLLTGKGKLLSFWEEINEQASRYKKHPFMVVRQNRMSAKVILDKAGMSKLGLKYKETLLISIPHDLFVVDADHFVNVCKPFTGE